MIVDFASAAAPCKAHDGASSHDEAIWAFVFCHRFSEISAYEARDRFPYQDQGIHTRANAMPQLKYLGDTSHRPRVEL
jgi:hypothetical protein